MVSAGDYTSGTNHILPTGGFARSYSGISVYTYLKSMQYQSITKSGLSGLIEEITNISKAENFYSSHGKTAELILKGKKFFKSGFLIK